MELLNNFTICALCLRRTVVEAMFVYTMCRCAVAYGDYVSW